MQPWWQAVTPHEDIREGRVNEGLFDAKLGQAARGEATDEYRDARLFFLKTYFTDGLTDLLTQVLRRTAGDREQNGVLWLQTGFGGGKSHSELAVYHLLEHPDEALSVPDIASLVQAAGVERPPEARVAVVVGTSVNPLGRTTEDEVRIRTLWGEVAYQLGGADAFSLVAENDALLQSPGEDTLIALLRQVGPCAILFDETLHYVDKVKSIQAAEESLAEQTVAFLRELTGAINAVPGTVMVVSLTASREDMLSDGAMVWLDRLNEHVLREATAIRPVQRSEIHEVVRRRLFEAVDDKVATETAGAYRERYAGMGGLPAEKTGAAYERLLARSYPFHPELVSVLYERWGTRQGFQETRDTLRFLALTLENLWPQREELESALIHLCDVDLGIGDLRGMARHVAADEQWESVIGTDIKATPGSELSKAELLDRHYQTGRMAEGLATAILLYSVGGGESPHATREGLRLACTQPGVPESLWDDILDRFQRRLFYFYWEESRFEFRKEPNVLSLQSTHRTNLKPDEVVDYVRLEIDRRALGSRAHGHGFDVYWRPEATQAVNDDEALKLVVLDPQFTANDGVPSEAAQRECRAILDRHGEVLRQNRNTLVFCVADDEAMLQARDAAADYLSWRRIQGNSSEWDRIGGAQQARVRENMETYSAATIKGIIGAYCWALMPTVAREEGANIVRLPAVNVGPYGPGSLIAPMVWERLTSSAGVGQAIMSELTPEVLLDRYYEHTWPRAVQYVTIRDLWERFCRQLALPVLRDQNVLLDMVRVGQQRGLFAVGHLTEDDSPRDQRDSYTALYFREVALPPQELPQIGQRWVLMRTSLYDIIVKRVTLEEVRDAVRAVDGRGRSASIATVYAYVGKGREAEVDKESFHAVVRQLAEAGEVMYSSVQDGSRESIPVAVDALMDGWVSEPKLIDDDDDDNGVDPPSGRRIAVQGALGSVSALGVLVTNILRSLETQKPKQFRIVVNVTAEWDDDPGAGLTATLQDGKAHPELKDVINVSDSRGTG